MNRPFKNRWLLFLCLVLGAAIITGCTKTEEPVVEVSIVQPVGILSGVEGGVRVLRDGEEEEDAITAAKSDLLYVGDTIDTGGDGKAEITLLDASIIRLAPDSRLLIEEYLLSGSTRKSGVVKLFKGKARAIVKKTEWLQTERFQIHTPTSTIGVRGTDFFVTHKNERTDTLVVEGVVAVFNNTIPEQIAMLTTGTATSTTVSEPPTLPRAVTEVEVTESINETTIGYKPPPPPPVEKKVVKKKKKVAPPPPPPPKKEPFMGGDVYKERCLLCHIPGTDETGWTTGAMSRHIKSVLYGVGKERNTSSNYDRRPVKLREYKDDEIEALANMVEEVLSMEDERAMAEKKRLEDIAQLKEYIEQIEAMLED